MTAPLDGCLTGAVERFDEEAVRRILARARPADEPEHDSGIDADALVAAAEEVGFDPAAVRDSIALERFEPSTPAPGVLDRWSGAAEVVIRREVPRAGEEVLRTATEWLQQAHRMVCRRVDDTTVTARRRSDLAATVGRSLTDLRGDGRLGRLAEVTVEVVPLAATADRPHRTMVRLSADRTPQRQRRLVAGGLLGGTGAATAAVGIAESMFAWPVAAVVLGGAGAVTIGSGRRHADRVEADLDSLLVALEADAAPVGTLRRAARAARRSVGR